ncbi:putative transcription factor ICE1-like [Capsicum annuum]|nr:putative transcription factor ICE1-like [Capsicum annuum]
MIFMEPSHDPSPTVLYTLISNKATTNLLYGWHVSLKEYLCANLWQVILAIADLRSFNPVAHGNTYLPWTSSSSDDRMYNSCNNLHDKTGIELHVAQVFSPLALLSLLVTEANILYLESPIGVGFSYSANTSSYEAVNDEITGHYLPQLAKLMVAYNKKQHLFNLKRVALRNPVLEFTTDFNLRAEYFWSHGLRSYIQNVYDSFQRLTPMLLKLFTNSGYQDSVVPLIGSRATVHQLARQMRLNTTAPIEFGLQNNSTSGSLGAIRIAYESWGDFIGCPLSDLFGHYVGYNQTLQDAGLGYEWDHRIISYGFPCFKYGFEHVSAWVRWLNLILIMPLRIFDFYENPFSLTEDNKNGAHPTLGVHTRSRATISDGPNGAPLIPSIPS